MEDIYADALRIIRSTRDKTLPHWGTIEAQTKHVGSVADVVTKIDFEIEEYLTKELTALDSSIAFAGEEYGGDRTASRYWLCDPIDGTAHYVRGLPFCTTMVALIDSDRVIFSAIYDFIHDHLYHAELGAGAFCNDEPISVSNRGVSDAYTFYESDISKEENLSTFLNLKKRMKMLKFLNTFNAGYEYAMVASGKVEARLTIDPFGKDYDFAPGSLLVSEAGGMVTNIGSSAFTLKNLSFIAANPEVHAFLTSGEHAPFPVK